MKCRWERSEPEFENIKQEGGGGINQSLPKGAGRRRRAGGVLKG